MSLSRRGSLSPIRATTPGEIPICKTASAIPHLNGVSWTRYWHPASSPTWSQVSISLHRIVVFATSLCNFLLNWRSYRRTIRSGSAQRNSATFRLAEYPRQSGDNRHAASPDKTEAIVRNGSSRPARASRSATLARNIRILAQYASAAPWPDVTGIAGDRFARDSYGRQPDEACGNRQNDHLGGSSRDGRLSASSARKPPHSPPGPSTNDLPFAGPPCSAQQHTGRLLKHARGGQGSAADRWLHPPEPSDG